MPEVAQPKTVTQLCHYVCHHITNRIFLPCLTSTFRVPSRLSLLQNLRESKSELLGITAPSVSKAGLSRVCCSTILSAAIPLDSPASQWCEGMFCKSADWRPAASAVANPRREKTCGGQFRFLVRRPVYFGTVWPRLEFGGPGLVRAITGHGTRLAPTPNGTVCLLSCGLICPENRGWKAVGSWFVCVRLCLFVCLPLRRWRRRRFLLRSRRWWSSLVLISWRMNTWNGLRRTMLGVAWFESVATGEFGIRTASTCMPIRKPGPGMRSN